MKLNKFIFLLITVVTLSATFAQTSHVVTFTTYKTAWPEGGKVAERDSLMKLWVDNVAMKNDKIVHLNVYYHYWGSDARDLVFAIEYKSLADIPVSDSISNDLWKKFMPDAAQRAEYDRKLNRYFETMHSDEIYRASTKFVK